MAFWSCSISRFLIAASFILIAYWISNMYILIFPATCDPRVSKKACLTPAYSANTELQLWVFTSTDERPSKLQELSLVLLEDRFRRDESFSRNVNVTVPLPVLNNGSLHAHIFLGQKGKSPTTLLEQSSMASTSVPLTKYLVPSAATFNLFSGEYEATPGNLSAVPVSHWVPMLNIHSVAEDFNFDIYKMPAELYYAKTLVVKHNTMTYLPLLYCNQLSILNRHLQLLSEHNTTVLLNINYSPVHIGLLRVWVQFKIGMKSMSALGFPEKELETVKELIFGTNLYLLGLTFFVSIFHLLFDALAFKNDISFWRGRKTMVGLSIRAILWRCFSQFVVFLYLMEEETSLLVLVPAGIASIIEFWKVRKALRIQVEWSRWIPKIKFGQQREEEKQTQTFDSQAMHYLSYLLVPLVIIGAVYSLVYLTYRSWYSWLIHSLVNGVYMFGFLFMLPQLFVNYKLKSVAHLPWRAFMYKAFNTFIDDVFAFIITMPTAHRVAVFRDDIVFLVYLYQRWLYPVDHSRVNEYGESFAENKTKEHKD